MNGNRKLALRKESLSQLTEHELHGLVGACASKGCGACINTMINCGDLLTIATCTCPTGETCVCPTQGGAGCA